MLNKLFLVLLSLMLSVFSLTFLHSRGTHDRITWEHWAEKSNNFGFIKAYEMNSSHSYPPLSFVILDFVGKVSKIFKIELFGGIKISITLFLFLTSICFFYFTKDIYLSLILHLSLLLNSISLGYIDVYFAPFLILALYFLKNNNFNIFSIFFSISIFIKWQPIILIPFIILYLMKINTLKNQWFYINILSPIVFISTTIIIIFGLFPIMNTLIAATSHNLLSGNALNFNWILTHFLRLFNPSYYGGFIDGKCTYIIATSIKEVIVSRFIFISLFVTAMVSFWNKKSSFENFLLFSILGYWSYFTFNIGVHENHLFIVNILSLLLYSVNKNYLSLAITLTLMSNINMFLFYGIDGSGLPFNRAILNLLDTAFLISIFNVLIFVLFWFKYVLTKYKEQNDTIEKTYTKQTSDPFSQKIW
tara:strand:+ start:1 stop:1254 length:1254 start_codon:yes stop_codon:yes gene_type:complete